MFWVLVVGTCRASLHIFYVNSLVLWTISWCFSRCVGCHVWIIFAQYTSNSSRIDNSEQVVYQDLRIALHPPELDSTKGVYQQMVRESILGQNWSCCPDCFLHIFRWLSCKKKFATEMYIFENQRSLFGIFSFTTRTSCIEWRSNQSSLLEGKKNRVQQAAGFESSPVSLALVMFSLIGLMFVFMLREFGWI